MVFFYSWLACSSLFYLIFFVTHYTFALKQKKKVSFAIFKVWWVSFFVTLPIALGLWAYQKLLVNLC